MRSWISDEVRSFCCGVNKFRHAGHRSRVDEMQQVIVLHHLSTSTGSGILTACTGADPARVELCNTARAKPKIGGFIRTLRVSLLAFSAIAASLVLSRTTHGTP